MYRIAHHCFSALFFFFFVMLLKLFNLFRAFDCHKLLGGYIREAPVSVKYGVIMQCLALCRQDLSPRTSLDSPLLPKKKKT